MKSNKLKKVSFKEEIELVDIESYKKFNIFNSHNPEIETTDRQSFCSDSCNGQCRVY